jgi:hypothetical protein
MTKADAEKVDVLAAKMLQRLDGETTYVAAEALLFGLVNVFVNASGSREVGEFIYEAVQDASWEAVERFGMLPPAGPMNERPAAGTRAWDTRGLLRYSMSKAKAAGRAETALRVKAARAGGR